MYIETRCISGVTLVSSCCICSIFSVLVSADVDWEVIRYLHGKQLMQMVTQSWKAFSGKGASQQTPWEHIEMEVELVAHYLQVSTFKYWIEAHSMVAGYIN